jgi:outer membrane cobalamin receptor
MMRRLAWATYALTLWSSAALAEAPEQGKDLEDLAQLLDATVVSAATRHAESSAVVPATVSVLSAEDMQRYGIKSLDQALNYLSLGMVTQNPLHSVDVGARGVLLTSDFGNHVLLLLDGQILNEPWDGTAYFERGAAIPWELVDHVEVILGPGSVLYGSNAMLGVINVVTKRAKDYGKLLLTVDGNGSAPVDRSDALASPSLSSSYFHNSGRDFRVAAGGATTFSLLGIPGEVIGQAEYYQAHGLAFTFGPQPYGLDSVTGLPKSFGSQDTPGIWGGLADRSYNTQIPTGLVKATWGDFQLELRAATYWRSTPYINEFNTFYGDFNQPNDGERDRFLNMDLRYARLVTPKLSLFGRLYGALYDYQQNLTTSAAMDCQANQPNGCFGHTHGASRWLGLELQGRYDWLLDGRAVTTFGVDGRLRNVAGTSSSNDLVTGALDTVDQYSHDESVLGVYVQQEASPISRLKLNAGLRLDVDSRFGSRLSPRLAAAYRLGESQTVKIVYGEAFRAPTAYELYYTDGVTQIPATHLQPETVRALEATYEQSVGPLKFLVGPFASWWQNMVLLSALTPDELTNAQASGQLPASSSSGFQYQNVSQIRNFGGNLGLEGRAGSHVRYALNLTIANTRRYFGDGSPPSPLTVAPEVFGNARVSYQYAVGSPSFALAAFFAGERPADRAFDGSFTPQPNAPTEVDLKATINGPIPHAEWLTYRFTVTYACAPWSPYVAGPIQAATPAFPSAELAPVDRLQLGLQLTARWQ